MTRTKVLYPLVILSLILYSNSTYANKCEPWVAKVISIEGEVERRLETSNLVSPWLDVRRGDELCAGNMVRVKKNSRAALRLKNNSILRLNQNTTITLSGFKKGKSHWINLKEGIAHFIARIAHSFKVVTPFVNAAVEGTEFVVSVNTSSTEITVFEGSVTAKNKFGKVKLTSGESAIARKNSSPEMIVRVKPRDAVNWSLYYPVIFDVDNYLNTDIDQKIKKLVKISIAETNKGNVKAALALLENIPDASLSIYKATLYLSIGRVNTAQEYLKAALKNPVTKAMSLALQAIIAIVQNNKTQALVLAEQAAVIAPDSITPAIALSYVHQSMFDIDAALNIIKKITKNNSDSSLLWARLSELFLMQGERDEAVNAAEIAININSTSARSYTILGYAYLSKFEAVEAELIFKKSIELDNSDPLSFLGLGLSIIRQGDLADGRLQIEYAATLDPNNALIRSYLGKAYYEEKRDSLAVTQFEMSQQLDPKDPTAYFYNAIYLQSINRSIEALIQLEKSKELNNNRAVYQSQLKLDQDEAARSASKARIYHDIGFGQQALLEGWQSILTDPANSAAHRLLADSYSTLDRHEIARVSELLQAQLLQPLNLNPIQPQLAVSNLGILDGSGPSENAYAEFNPLFTRNALNFQVNTILGSQNTQGNDLVISGLYEKVSYSFGQFFFKSNGFRDNNDVRYEIYNSFVQIKATDNLNVQFENRIVKTKAGDLLFAFDPEVFKKNERKIISSVNNRVGFNYRATVKHTVVGSMSTNNRFETKSDFSVTSGPPFPVKNTDIRTYDEKAESQELQYIYNSNNSKFIIGISRIDLKQDNLFKLTQSFLPPGPSVSDTTIIPSENDTRHVTAYLYNYKKIFKKSSLILGVSVDDFKLQNYKINAINPKLGFQTDISTNTLFRISAFTTVTRPLLANQTIEPTNIVGFNQLFDDFRGSKIKRFGFAFDHSFSRNFKGGIEPSIRSLDVTEVIDSNNSKIDLYEEHAVRTYFNYIVNNNITISTDLTYENLSRSAKNNKKSPPLEVKNIVFPIALNYFSTSGISVQLRTKNVNQIYKDNASNIQTDNFWITDLSISYRLPKRMGILSLNAMNLLDQKFNFYDIQFTGEPKLPTIQPERSLNIKFSLFL